MGFWNARTMNQISKTEQVLKEMRQYLIDTLVLSEIRWTGNGLEKFGDGYVMAFSGHPSVHRAGVGLLMSPLAHKAMTNWNPVNERIKTARFVSNHTKMTIIACYAPTNEADEEEKDAFYNMLHSVTKDVPRHDVLCVVGDLNAKVGADRHYYPEVLGPHGMGEINENGTLLIDYALSNDLIIGGSMFDHKTIHKYTWVSPDGRTKNQIDHFLMSRRWRSSLSDVRGFRGADVNSDHILMIAEVRIKMKAQKRKTNTATHKQFDTDKLKDPDIRKNFCIFLHNGLEALNLLNETNDFDIENTWTSVKSVYHDVAKANLGFKKRKKEEWISDDTWKYISKRKETRTLILNTSSPEQKAQLQLRYKEEDKAVKRSARKDNRIAIERKAALAEEAAKKGDSKMVYRLTNEIVGKKTNRTPLVKDENGDVISDPQKAYERWASHF
ncbi:craniofacial development protein 2-like [Artemia franciscana]|uniref:craniofacial development protein 2-like n=1 Tax=Artemia franciscana TaxID=6661 RepID=UPI0032D9E24C